MDSRLQEGIYYLKKERPGNSFALIFLRMSEPAHALHVGTAIENLWLMYQDLKKGKIKDLAVDARHRSSGNLSVLIGYGRDVFSLIGSNKGKPVDFNDRWRFKPPSPMGGGEILDGSTILYRENVNENHALSDHIIIQFIADSEFYTQRAIVETWKELNRETISTEARKTLRMTSFYMGSQRPDNRNWLGFHDGISNLKSRERRYVISIPRNSLSPADAWIANGTYLAFLRIYVDIEKWEATEVENQEIIIGRDKLSGCPLIGIDKKGRPRKDIRCPVQGTSEVTDPGNEYYRDHPTYGRMKASLTRIPRAFDLSNSHIGMMRPIDRIPVWNKKSFRIFRQGFEFIENTNDYPYFRVGLNFVSFQNSPERLFKTLTYGHIKEALENNQPKRMYTLNDFLSVTAAGIFFVPPVKSGESFPGAGIFFGPEKVMPKYSLNAHSS